MMYKYSMDILDLVSRIQKTKKYARVYGPLLGRACVEESAKYKKDKDIIKAVKNRLHMTYGAFAGDPGAARELISGGGDIVELSEKLLRLNTSSRERAGFVREFYGFIFGVVPAGDIRSVLDAGCGFNPFALPFMAGADIKEYHALDMDTGLAEAINGYFGLLGLPRCAGCIDIVAETPPQKCDIAFLFKLIPTIEACKKGRGAEIMEGIDAKYIAVSFPARTLCGKNIGMAENYAGFFERDMDRGKFTIAGKKLFENELVYVLKRER